jgi:hypothetical protein
MFLKNMAPGDCSVLSYLPFLGARILINSAEQEQKGG